MIEQAVESEEEQLDTLAEAYGDAGKASNPKDNDNDMSDARASGTPTSTTNTDSRAMSGDPPLRKRRRAPKGSSCRTQPSTKSPNYLDEAWREDEDILEMEISEAINSPSSAEHARAFQEAQECVNAIMLQLDERAAAIAKANPNGHASISTNPEIQEDEFANDPEVLHCLLSTEESQIKETIWLNENSSYLRQKQEKEFKAKLAADGPKKQTRRRVKKPKIGEGQTSAASTPGEAAVADHGASRLLQED